MIGATGAVGREMVNFALQNKEISEFTLIIRKKLPAWEEKEKSDETFKSKVKFIIKEDFDDLTTCAEELRGYNGFICCLGTRRKYGEDNFIKVDYQYPLNFANLAKQLEIPFYGLLTSMGSKSSSMFLYMKTKGRVEEACTSVGIKSLVIYKPGLITDRDNDFRLGEKIGEFVPFIDKISAANLANSMLLHSIHSIKNPPSEITKKELDNKLIKSFLKQSGKL